VTPPKEEVTDNKDSDDEQMATESKVADAAAEGVKTEEGAAEEQKKVEPSEEGEAKAVDKVLQPEDAEAEKFQGEKTTNQPEDTKMEESAPDEGGEERKAALKEEIKMDPEEQE